MSKKETEKQRCRVIVSHRFANRFTLDQAINMAMENTLETNNEVMFFYDVETKEVLSPIVAGDCGEIDIEIQAGTQAISEAIGTFHTHPVTPEPLIEEIIAEFKQATVIPSLKKEMEVYIESSIKEIREQLADKGCEFSTSDLHTNFIVFPFKEIKIGCPSHNEILTLQYSPKLNKILFDIATLEEKSSCSSQMGKSTNLWADKLDEIFPQHKKEIEESRFQWINTGLPVAMENAVDELMKQLRERIRTYPITRQEWKKRKGKNE